MEGLFDYSLWGLFLASFLAATVVPFSSEALLSFLIVNGTDAYTAVLVASAGNWLGGMSSYAIGYLGKWEWIEKYLRIKRETIEKWHDRLYKRGAIFAFLCWVPGSGRYFCCRAWPFTRQYFDNCHCHAGRKVFTLCNLGMAYRAGILRMNGQTSAETVVTHNLSGR